MSAHFPPTAKRQHAPRPGTSRAPQNGTAVPGGQRSRLLGTLVIGSLCFACGSSMTFEDTTPIRIATAPAPEPEPEAPAPQKQVQLRDNRIELSERIQFDYNMSKLLGESLSTLNEVASTLRDNPHVKKVSIEGHASSEGTDQHNMILSKARAHAVRAYLIAQGVSASRLSAKGFGENQPIANNDTESGREANRRVEFNIVEQDVTEKQVEVDPSTGEETVLQTSHNGAQ